MLNPGWPDASKAAVKMCVRLTRSELLNGRGLNISVQDPHLLSVAEFEQLRAVANSRISADKAYLHAWLAAAQSEVRRFDAAEFLAAHRGGAVWSC